MSKNNLLTQKEMAEYLGTTVGSLNTWRCQNRYPIPFIKVGSLVRYNLDDVNKWLKTRTQNSLGDVRDD